MVMVLRHVITFIDDIINGVMGAIKFLENNHCFEVINLGESVTVSLIEMVQIISEEMGMKVNSEFVPMQPGDVTITYADISKAKRMIGYDPQTDFRSGIIRFLNWYKNNNK